ncbi:MAG: malate dehydrogenase [Candidatus Margulisiibacteriota bacterium]
MPKVSVIGAGNVGAEVARRIVEKNLADVVLVDIVDGVPQGKALDILQSAPVECFTKKIEGTNDYAQILDSDIVVVTAGLARKPGMTREDLVMKNGQIIKEVSRNIKKYAPKSIVVMVTNPLDVMTQLCWKTTGFDNNKVVGMAGILDTSRFVCFLSAETKTAADKIEAVVLGGHGDAMVPLIDYTFIDGRPVKEVVAAETLAGIVQRTRDGGAEIVKLLKTGSAYYAPSSSAVEMVDCILNDKKKVLPCSTYLKGQYGLLDVFIGVPVKIGASGAEEIIELKLTDEEKHELHRSARVIKDTILLCEK